MLLDFAFKNPNAEWFGLRLLTPPLGAVPRHRRKRVSQAFRRGVTETEFRNVATDALCYLNLSNTI